MSTVLVIARKFNDIFYALSTEESEKANYKILVIISPKEKHQSFPLVNKFDEVYYIDASEKGTMGLLKQSLEVNKLRIRTCQAAILSNPILTINQLLINRFKVKEIIFIEDGLMNYYDFTPSGSKKKKIWQLLLGINQNKILDSISTTYLLSPNDAQYYYGKKKKLQVDGSLVDGMPLPNIDGKRIFIGQNIYMPCYGICSITEYNTLVNAIIKRYGIDYYLPHSSASTLEKIDCQVLDINKYHITLEYCAVYSTFEVYSYNSSVLYTTKLVNPNVKSFAIDMPFSKKQDYPDILRKICDKIYYGNTSPDHV